MIWQLKKWRSCATNRFSMRDELTMLSKKISIQSCAVFRLIIFPVLVSGCRPEPIDTGSLEIVYTFRRSEAEYDFSTNRTFSMPSQVYPLGSGDPLDSSFDRLIIDTVATQMAQAGYDRVIFDSEMQSAVVIFVSKTTEDGWMFGGEQIHNQNPRISLRDNGAGGGTRFFYQGAPVHPAGYGPCLLVEDADAGTSLPHYRGNRRPGCRPLLPQRCLPLGGMGG